jgi:hypothetical protein
MPYVLTEGFRSFSVSSVKRRANGTTAHLPFIFLQIQMLSGKNETQQQQQQQQQ